MSLSNRTVFLGGATGMTGMAVLKHLLNKHPEDRIRAVRHRHTLPVIEDERVEYVSADLRSAEDCRRSARGCDCAVMAAASTGGAWQLINEPWRQVNDNLIMNARLLEAFHLEGVKRAVCVGTASVYQESSGALGENDLDLNRTPHPAHRGVASVARFLEQLCAFWHEQYGIEILIARAANIFGPYDKFSPQRSNFIPALIRKAADRMDPFEVWGSPDVSRDAIYSEDLARAVVKMLDSRGIGFGVFNIGSGAPASVSDVVGWALKHSGHSPSKISYLPNGPATLKHRALDCSRARNRFGWAPRIGTEEGIRRTAEWWRKNRTWWQK